MPGYWEEYERGWAAYKAGCKFCDNPYVYEAGASWAKGWKDAAEEAEGFPL